MILLILATITISALAGSGLFNNANSAKEKHNLASAQEEMEIKLQAIEVDYELHGGNAAKIVFTGEKLEVDPDIEYVHLEANKQASIAGLDAK